MQPRPSAETSRPLCPSMRVFIVRILCHGSGDEPQRKKGEEPGDGRHEQSHHDRALPAATVCIAPRPEARAERRRALCASDEADDEGTEAEALVNVKRKYRNG